MLFFALLLGVGAIFSFILSKWYIRPILKGFDAIRNVYGQEPGGEGPGGTHHGNGVRVNIPEIDDLMEFLFLQNEGAKAQSVRGERQEPEDGKNITEGRRFSEDSELLTSSEKNVLDLYLEGRSAKEIAAALNLSVNTIKTHNKHIFMKLNVSSRIELLLRARELHDKKTIHNS